MYSTRGGGLWLCDELWIDILSRLPVNRMSQCKCVSRSWRRLISDVCLPSRVSLNSELPLSGLYFPTQSEDDDDDGMPLIIRDSAESFMFDCYPQFRLSNNKNVQLAYTKETYNHPSFLDNEFLLDSCNGLLLFISPDDCSYIVWNPCTSECVPIPKARCHHNRVYAALAFNPRESPCYRVVSFTLTETNGPVLDIFSSHTAKWIRFPVSDLLQDSFVCNFCWVEHSIYLDGSLYRLSKSLKDILPGKLLQFDLNNINARAIYLPLRIWMAKDSIGCIGLSKNRLYYAKPKTCGVAVWLFDGSPEDEPWTWKYYVNTIFVVKELKTNFAHLLGDSMWLEPCSFHPNDDNVIFLKTPHGILSYNHIERSLKEVCRTRGSAVKHGGTYPSFTCSRLLISMKHLLKIPYHPLEKMSKRVKSLDMKKASNDPSVVGG